jgi:acylphosphatase
MRKRLHAYISGRVQMVMFRDFAQRNASRLGVSGWVKNLSDGRVEVLAEGEKHDLDLFLAKLNHGPILARVDRVEVEWSDAIGDVSGFRIVYR